MKVFVLKDDITTLNVDIVVNAANRTLLGGGGVDGAIHRKAGKALLDECKSLNGCDTGEAKMTDGYNMPCKKIIHTVGPIYHDGLHGEHNFLEKCYYNSMKLALSYMIDNKLEQLSIAFPCISTGIYHFPKEKAAKIATQIVNLFQDYNINVYFVCFEDKDYKIYNDLISTMYS